MHNVDRLLRPLYALSCVHNSGSFSAAAAEMGVSPPLISHLIAELEEALGAQLVYRSTRRVRLTDAGITLLEGAQPSFQQIEDSIEQISKRKSAPSGKLKIAVPSVLAAPRFAKFVSGFCARFSEISLEVVFDDVFRDPLSEGIDLAIRIGHPKDSAQIARKLFETEGIVLGAPDCPIYTHPSELRDKVFVGPATLAKSLHLSNGSAQVTLEPKRSIVVNSGVASLQVMISSGGFSVFPAFAVRDTLNSGEAVNILPTWSMPSVPVIALFTARDSRLSAARVFVDALLEELADG